MSFTQTFGGTTIYPSDVSYLALALTANTTLEWPLERGTGSNLVASIIDITPTGAYDITLPSAMLTGVGQTVLFNNLGPSTVTVKGSTGSTLLSLASGEVWQIYLTDNSTAAGSWRTFKYGASTAQAQASALAGSGLVAIGSTLAQTSTINSTSITPQTIGTTDLASTYLWTGGLGTFNLPSAITAGNGWFFNVRNSGTGDLTLDPAGGETINGSASIVLSPNDSAVIATDGTSWYTIGLGQQAIFAFDYTSISLAGLGNPSTTTDYTLSGTELNRIAYTFTGAPLGNINIVVPFTVQQYWVANSTTGSFTLSISTLGGTASQISQNARAIYYCTGAQIVKADTSSGLPFPVVIAQGGTGATTATDALTNLGGTTVGKAVFVATSESVGRTAILAAASGANSDITSLTGLTTPLTVAQGGTGQSTYTNGQLLIGNTTGNTLTKATLTQGTGITITNGAGSIIIASTGGTGTVTSVAQSFTGGLISVAGSPITTSGTLALTVAGTSGGIPYFSSASTWATSAALAANALMVGGGAGVAPATVTTGTGVVTALGVNVGTAGAIVVNGGVLGTPSSGTVTNLTGTASININGTVGATTASSGAFTTLSTTGQVTQTGVTGLAGAIGPAIADYFTSTISLDASSIYTIECQTFALKTTAGTVVWTWTFSSAPTWVNSFVQGNPITGVTAASNSSGTTFIGGTVIMNGQTTAAHPASGSLDTAVFHGFRFKVNIRTNAATTIQLRATESAGTITPQAGSYMRATKVI